ncbi:MAG: amidase, partial [SAR324 cluster bacterium]
MNDLIFASATAIAKSIKAREVSCVRMLDLYLERVERHNPKINAIIALNIDPAKKRALEADQALDRGENWGPLHGVPMTIKDAFEVTGMPTTSGSEDLKHYM